MTITVSPMDVTHLAEIRGNVRRFLAACAREHGSRGRLLDVAPQDHEGAAPFFVEAEIETLDVAPTSGATYVADLCHTNDALIPDARFDVVVCTEVLEHVLDPFAAAREIRRVLRPGGMLFATTPFNFRIHGPLPDCWRFTEHGLRALLRDFAEVRIQELATPGRDLMPIQYTTVARR